VDLDKLGNVNARLVRAREAYHQALIAEHQAKQPGAADSSPPLGERKGAGSTKERVRQTAEEYDEALAEFIKFTVARRSA
jgi:hypothetical protein